MTKQNSGPVLSLDRRGFLGGAGAALGASALGLGFAPKPAYAANANKTLVYIFLRGGMDGLSLVPPISGVDYNTHYRDARDRTFIDINDSDAIDRPIDLDGVFGLHPFSNPSIVPDNLNNTNVATHGLKQLWDQNKLAIVHACGHVAEATRTRSHFDAQEQIELGTPGIQNSIDGWLARYLLLDSANPNVLNNAVFSALAASSNPPLSLNGWPDIATLSATGNFHPNYGNNTYHATLLASLATMYDGAGAMDAAARAAVDAVALVEEQLSGDYAPSVGVVYPDAGVGDSLALAARLIKQNIGVATVTVDVGGWDTHQSQNVLNSGSSYGRNIWQLSAGLGAFYFDLAGSGMQNDVAIIVQSEFGRQISENDNFGTDHGLGNPMLVIGGGVTGGLYGTWPGIAIAERDADSLVPTTDFRDVQATVMERLMGLTSGNAEAVFSVADPGYSYSPLGFA